MWRLFSSFYSIGLSILSLPNFYLSSTSSLICAHHHKVLRCLSAPFYLCSKQTDNQQGQTFFHLELLPLTWNRLTAHSDSLLSIYWVNSSVNKTHYPPPFLRTCQKRYSTSQMEESHSASWRHATLGGGAKRRLMERHSVTVVDGAYCYSCFQLTCIFCPCSCLISKVPFLSYASFFFSFKVVLWAKFSLVLYTAIPIQLTSMAAFSPLMAEFGSYDSCLPGPWSASWPFLRQVVWPLV